MTNESIWKPSINALMLSGDLVTSQLLNILLCPVTISQLSMNRMLQDSSSTTLWGKQKGAKKEVGLTYHP
jgi:hypothetical protein